MNRDKEQCQNCRYWLEDGWPFVKRTGIPICTHPEFVREHMDYGNLRDFPKSIDLLLYGALEGHLRTLDASPTFRCKHYEPREEPTGGDSKQSRSIEKRLLIHSLLSLGSPAYRHIWTESLATLMQALEQWWRKPSDATCSRVSNAIAQMDIHLTQMKLMFRGWESSRE